MYTRFKVPIIAALVILTTLAALVPTVGFVWLGWRDIPQNRKVLDSLPLPPGAGLYYLVSDPNYTADSLIIPHNWSTLAKYRVPGRPPEYLTVLYISELRSKWDYCRRRSDPGARFIARNFVVSLHVSGAAAQPTDTGSFEILVEYDRRGDPCRE